MNVLELFSRTHSHSRECKKRGYTVVSVDINNYNNLYNTTPKCNIILPQ